MEVLGKSKYLLTLLGFCLPREENFWLKMATFLINVIMAIFIVFGGIVTSILYILEHVDDISLVIQALYQIFAIVSVFGVFFTFAPQKYLIHDIFAQLKRLVDTSKDRFYTHLRFTHSLPIIIINVNLFCRY